jgi:hypothetical protein
VVDSTARSFVARLLARRDVPGVSVRLRRQWMATGRPVAELALIVRAHPDLLPVIEAYLRGEAVREPASTADTLLAGAQTDAAEDVAEARALIEDTADAWDEFARRSEVAAARSIEVARVARMEAEARR